MMLFFILVVAAIVLIDLSGGNLNDKITPLIYICSDEDIDKKATDTVNFGNDLSPEELAAKARAHIFGDKNGGADEGDS